MTLRLQLSFFSFYNHLIERYFIESQQMSTPLTILCNFLNSLEKTPKSQSNYLKAQQIFSEDIYL